MEDKAYPYNKVVFETIQEVWGEKEACLFARSATVGGQKFPVHWGGNCIIGQLLSTRFSRLCGCQVTEYDPIGEKKQRLRMKQGGVYEITSWCDLLELDTAQALGTIGEKAIYRTLLLKVFAEQGIPPGDTSPGSGG